MSNSGFEMSSKRSSEALSPIASDSKKAKLPPDTPAWAESMHNSLLNRLEEVEANVKGTKELYSSICIRIDDFKKEVTKSIDYATDSAVSALKIAKTCETECERLRNENEQLKCDMSRLSRRIEVVNAGVIAQENYSRRDNLVFKGIPELGNEDCERTIRDILLNKLKLPDANRTVFVRCHRVGATTPGRSRPIIARFRDFQIRQNVWNARRNLRGSNIFIDEDFAKEVEERRRVFYPILKLARESDVYRNKVYLKVDRLWVNDNMYTVDQVNQLPEGLNPAKKSTPTKNGVTLFFTKLSPLSNFHPCQLKVDGKYFSSSEQCYQYKKALAAGDEITARQIMGNSDPVIIKRLGASIKIDSNLWQEQARNVMATVVTEKFKQNGGLRKALVDTHPNVLGEASQHDRYWGIGLGLNDPNAFKQQHWSGQNHLGKIL